MGVKNRHPLSDKDAEALQQFLAEAFGMEPFQGAIERGDSPEGPVLLVDGEVVAWQVGDAFWPTIDGLLTNPASKAWVTVDMGAVPHVTNGADAMAPGIVDADDAIEEGDPVWIRDVKNEQPIGVGRARESGPEMVEADGGKSVATLHHVGDDLFELAP